MSLLAQDTALTRRVGAIACAVILASIVFFVFVWDRLDFGSHIRVRVYFHSSGGLREGAPFVVAGREVGQIESIAFVAHGSEGPLGGDEGVVITVKIDRDIASELTARPWPAACCSDAGRQRAIGDVFVASRGAFSARYLELAPAPEGSPTLRDGDKLLGSDPPTLDRVLQRTWENTQVVRKFAAEVGPELTALQTEIATLRAQFDVTGGNVNALAEAAQLMGPLIDDASDVFAQTRQLRDVALGGEAGMAKLGSLIDETRSTIAYARRTLGRIDTRLAELSKNLIAAQERFDKAGSDLFVKIELAVDRVRAAIAKVDPLLAQIDAINARIARGEGSLLKLANDPEFPEDAKELGKILKRQPWKVMDRPAQ